MNVLLQGPPHTNAVFGNTGRIRTVLKTCNMCRQIVFNLSPSDQHNPRAAKRLPPRAPTHSPLTDSSAPGVPGRGRVRRCQFGDKLSRLYRPPPQEDFLPSVPDHSAASVSFMCDQQLPLTSPTSTLYSPSVLTMYFLSSPVTNVTAAPVSRDEVPLLTGGSNVNEMEMSE